MINKFKEGDKVRFKNDEEHQIYKKRNNAKGEIFVVDHTSSFDSDLLYVYNQSNPSEKTNAFFYRFELVENFKVGDEVQVVRDPFSLGILEAVGTVAEVLDGDRVTVRIPGWISPIKKDTWNFFTVDKEYNSFVVPYNRTKNFKVGDFVGGFGNSNLTTGQKSGLVYGTFVSSKKCRRSISTIKGENDGYHYSVWEDSLFLADREEISDNNKMEEVNMEKKYVVMDSDFNTFGEVSSDMEEVIDSAKEYAEDEEDVVFYVGEINVIASVITPEKKTEVKYF